MPFNSKRNLFYYGEYWKLAAVVLLSIVSWGLFQIDGRYIVTKSQILPNLDFRQSAAHWMGTPQGIRLSATPQPTLLFTNDGRKQTVMTRMLQQPRRYENIRIALDIKVDGVEAGRHWWQRAGAVLISFDRDNDRMTYWPSRIALLSGTQAWKRYEVVIPTIAHIARMQLFLLHGGVSGAMQIRNLQIDAARQALWFTALEASLKALWFGAGVWILLPLLLQRHRSLRAYLALAAFLATLGASLMPQPLISHASEPAVETLAEISKSAGEIARDLRPDEPDRAASDADPAAEAAKTASDKPKVRATPPAAAISQPFGSDVRQYAAHFVSHVVIGVLAGLAFRGTSWRRLFPYLLIAAAANELLQVFVITRSTSLEDGLSNAAGVAAGLLAALAWRAASRVWAAPRP